MSHTRAELDRKITKLEERAKELTPRQLTRRLLPEYFTDQVIGGILTLVGVKLAWAMYRKNARRHDRLKTLASAYERW